MAADDGGNGGSFGHLVARVPVWAWAVGLGGVVGAWWYLRSRKGATTGADDTASTTDAQDTTGAAPTTIMPINQGLSDQQYKDLLAAIGKLQGAPSTPTTPTTPVTGGTPPKVGSNPPTTPKPKPKPKPVSGTPKPTFITAKDGDTYTKIAAEYGHTAAELWAYQLTPGVRPPATQKTLRARGINHALFAGSSIAIPSTWKKK